MQHIYKQTEKAQMLFIKVFGIKEIPTKKNVPNPAVSSPKNSFYMIFTK